MKSSDGDHVNEDMHDVTRLNNINAGTEGTANKPGEPSTRGTESAMVWFKQSNSVVSIFGGSGVSDVFWSLLNVAELL